MYIVKFCLTTACIFKITMLHVICEDVDSVKDDSSYQVKNKKPILTLPDPEQYDFIERFKQQLQLARNTNIFYPNLKCDKVVNTTLIQFLLFTRSAPNPYEITNYAGLKSSSFNVHKQTTIVVHGWVEEGVSFGSDFANAYLKKGSTNVVSVDWGHYALCEYFYTKNTLIPLIGQLVTNMVKMMIKYGATLDSFHLIGHSFGAHIMGYAGQYMLPDKYPRITGLDAAGATFNFAPNNEKLSTEDAEFVDVIHTNAGQYGIDRLIGHVDFFVNGGTLQPSCNPVDVVCNHQISVTYYIESITNPYAFCAQKCFSFAYYETKKCAKAHVAYMGEYVSNTTRGTYYVNTNKKPPYGYGC